jgi:hypothetical protein
MSNSPATDEDFTDATQLKRKVEWPASYVYSIKDSSDNIQFMALEESTNTHPEIKAATLPKLVERLTYSEYVGKILSFFRIFLILFLDPQYVFVFLLTYRSFATSKEFLDLLLDR